MSPFAGTRAQRMQRLQIGLFGLGAMVLLVGLANIIMTSAQQTQANSVPEAAPTVAASGTTTPNRDPLADAGVVPDLPTELVAEPTAAQPEPINGPASPQP